MGTVDLLDSNGVVGSRLLIQSLPKAKETTIDLGGSLLTITEGATYRYAIELPDGEAIIRLEPSELFDPDDVSCATGRLSAGESVGVVTVEVDLDGGSTLRGQFDVRVAKLSDEESFSQMLQDLARLSVEALHHGFAPSSGAYQVDGRSSPQLLYQQFAVLHALLNSSDLPLALERILHRPHTAWVRDVEVRHPGQSIRGSSLLTRQVGRQGRRVPTPSMRTPSLPDPILVEHTVETLDTVPNRYVRFVLEHWRNMALSLQTHTSGLQPAASRRGHRQIEDVLQRLDEVLGQPLFREIGELRVFPGDNQVLRRREGYREFAGTAALINASLGLNLGLQDPLLVSRRSVSLLYEYWTFAQLARAVGEMFNQPEVAHALFRPARHGMALVLKSGLASRLQFRTFRSGRELKADLFFNRQFEHDSWTRPMRPDASLLVRAVGTRGVWLHFDAKYKVAWEEGAIEGSSETGEESAEKLGFSKRVDLLKMHAYRDAIRDSAGSYILFPGSETSEFSMQNSEILPGLGAFPMRPDKVNEDFKRIQAFIQAAIEHVASDGTRYRRAKYWQDRAFREPGSLSWRSRPPIGELPPADSLVLISYVRSEEQWNWITEKQLYNIRGGTRRGALRDSAHELAAEILLLWGPGGRTQRSMLCQRTQPWDSLSGSELRALGYPHPRGDSYLVTGVVEMPTPDWLQLVDPQQLAPRGSIYGAPFAVTWLDLVLSTQEE